MSNYKILHRRARTLPIAEFHRYLMQRGGGKIHIFMEGSSDPAFYMPHVRNACPSDKQILIYTCDGKSGVLHCHDKHTKTAMPEDCHLFFVDKDLDDLLGSPPPPNGICVTSYYSIENSVVCESSLGILIDDFIGQKHITDIRVLLDLYKDREKDFVRLMKLLMALILSLREIGAKPNLNNVNLAKLIKFSHNDRIKFSPKPVTELNKQLNISMNEYSSQNIKKWHKKLSAIPYKHWLRGKYELWFLEEFVERLLQEGHKATPKLLSKKIRVKNEIRKGSLLATLSARLPPPPEIKLYLETELGKLATA